MVQRTINICLIGAGKLGIRHAESICRHNFSVNLFIVDPDPGTCSRLSCVLGGFKTETSLTFLESVDQLPDEVEIAIMATTSDVRLELLSMLVEARMVKYLILEKVAFRSSSELKKAWQICKNNNLKMWVNCARRVMPGYQKIRDYLHELKPFHFVVEGNLWGLACNAIHHIDYVSWVTGSTPKEIDCRKLDKNTHFANRVGFIEVFGQIEIRYAENQILLLRCENLVGEQPTMETCVWGSSGHWKIIEKSGEILLLDDNGDIQLKDRLWFQSELTASVINDLINYGDCRLTRFEESMVHHQVLLTGLSKHLSMIYGREITQCDIT